MARLILLLLLVVPQVITPGGLSGAGPSIQTLSPNTGAVGATVTISGQNLGASQGSSTVTFNGVAATVTSWSAVTLIATVPSTTTGGVIVTVGGIASNGLTFTVTGGGGSVNSCTGHTCFYVRPNGSTYGTGTGLSWTNAWSGFSGITWASVNAGDTIWVAGGTYTQNLVPAKSGTNGNPIHLRRARSDDLGPTAAAGWSAGFDSTITQTAGTTTQNINDINIDGRTTAAGGTQGWVIHISGTSGLALDMGGNGFTGSRWTVEWLELWGPGANATYTNDGRGIDMTPFSSMTGQTFSHLKIHDWETAIYCAGASNPTWEYIEMYDINAANSATFHPNGIINSDCPNGVVRYSIFYKGPAGFGVGEGIFFEQNGGSTDWKIYGNIFYNLTQTGWKAIEISAAVGAIQVYNNTFDNILVGSLYTSDSWSCSGGLWKNNLVYQADENHCGTASNNVTAGSAAVFTNQATHDYHIVATTGAGFPRNAGTNLSTVFTLDRDGVTFGADGTWDVGAYEKP